MKFSGKIGNGPVSKMVTFWWPMSMSIQISIAP